MKKLLIASVIAAMGSTAMAADLSGMSIGAGYGFGNGGVVSVHGDYDISQMVNKQPIKVRVGYDRYSEEFGGFGYNYKWAYNVFYGGAYYDFGKALQLGNKIHPFAGLGFGFGNATATCSGAGFNCSSVSSPTVGGFYYIFGAQYDLTPNVAAEANFNGWGGLSLGVNYKF
jgi:opacity protein-like surface antigen